MLTPTWLPPLLVLTLASWLGTASHSLADMFCACVHNPGSSLCPQSYPCCRSESMTVNNFFSNVDGQLELLAQATLDSTVSCMGTLHALRPRLSRFHQLLLEPPQVGQGAGGREVHSLVSSSTELGTKPPLCLQLEPLCTTWGTLAPPLGNTRLHVVKLLASALSANDAALTQELLALDVPNTMLVRLAGLLGRVGWGQGQGLGTSLCPLHQDLFFHYVFNNFLHTQVEVCVSAMLSAGPPSDSSLEMPAQNPVVKHVSWGSRVPPQFPWGGLCPRYVPHLSCSQYLVGDHILGLEAQPCS